MSPESSLKTLYRSLFLLHVFVGVGAISGGMVAILDPEAPMGVPTDLLDGSPFTNYLIPGIILFTVLGLGNLVGAWMSRRSSEYQGYVSSIFSWALMVWIAVQCVILGSIHFLHAAYFTIGLAGAFMAALLLFRQRLFPTNIIVEIVGKLRRGI